MGGPSRWQVWTLASLLALAPLRAAPSSEAELPRIGVGGGMRIGLGGVLLRAGLPFDYLTDHEQCDPAILARYDLLLIASLENYGEQWRPDALRALDTWVRGGGRLLCEMNTRLPDGMKGFKAKHAGQWPPKETGSGFKLEPGAHLVLRGLPAERRWDYGGSLMRVTLEDPKAVVLARFDEGEVKGQPAIVSRGYGAGQILYFAPMLAYIQGNWHPDYEDLFLAAFRYLTQGEAVPQWSPRRAPPRDNHGLVGVEVPPDSPPRPAGFTELGVAGVEGFAVRVPRGPDAPAVTLLLDREGDRPYVGSGNAHLELTVDRSAELARVTPRGRTTLASVPVRGEVVLVQRPDRLELVVGGVVAFTRPDQSRLPYRSCAAKPADAVLWQPLEPLWQTDDFARAGRGAGGEWRQKGTWRLTGSVRPYDRVAPFALRGWDGEVSAGEWFWGDYRFEASVRPRGADQVRVQVARSGDRRLELRCAIGRGESRLVRRVGRREEDVLAGLPPLLAHQWTRVGVTLARGRASVAFDGERLGSAAVPESLGGVGLGVHGGDALFDDTEVASVGLIELNAPPGQEIHPARFDKGPEGLLDRDSWSHPAAAWVPTGQPASFRHVGRFAGDLRVTVRARVVDWKNARLRLHLSPDRDADAPVLEVGERLGWVWQAERKQSVLEVMLERRGQRLTAEVNGRRLTSAGVTLPVAPPGAVCLGLDWRGLAVAAEDVTVEAADVDEWVSERAPSGWWEGQGDWRVGSRWSCQPQWAWLTGRGTPRAAWWSKHRVKGDLAVQTYYGVRMLGRFGQERAEPYERLRLTLCGNGQDPWSGYVVEVGSGVEGLSRLYRRHHVVATTPARLPHWREIHNSWPELRAERQGATIRVTFHGRPFLEYTDPQPLPDGQVCLWTEDNTLVVPYVAVYGRRQAHVRPLAPELVKEEQGRRERLAARPGFRPLPAALALAALLGWEGGAE